MKTLSGFFTALLLFLPASSRAQVNSGSNGSDGALSPTANLVIDMADHPDGIYHYTSVNIPAGVTVSFIPNAGNKPVVWLVQGYCVIEGTVNLDASLTTNSGGAGGFGSGNSGTNPSPGSGPGGGAAAVDTPFGGYASYGTQGTYSYYGGRPPGSVYGNSFLLPLIGGSGGGGGGGALLIASSNTIQVNGAISARGGADSGGGPSYSGYGSGGGIRFVAASISGTGAVDTGGGNAGQPNYFGGDGRVRFDCYSSNFSGTTRGVFSQGFQPIIIPAAGQGIQLSIASIAGNAISPTHPAFWSIQM